MQSDDSKICATKTHKKPTIIAHSEHGLASSQISKNALTVLHKLHESDYAAYLVGGCIRDILLGIKPKDFDVVTNARPEQIRALFRNCRLIGRRFRLAHVYFGGEIIEVSTFRAPHDNANNATDGIKKNGRVIRDNVYGNLDDDVWRRDLTINALYYNIKDLSIIDYVNGIQDIQNKNLQIIGVATDRFREDPVRMLRILRFAGKLDFSIHADCVEPIIKLAHLLKDIPQARLFDESVKLFMGGKAVKCYHQLRKYGLFRILFPQTEAILTEDNPFAHEFILSILSNTDQRIANKMPVTPAFLLAAMLWIPVNQLAKQYQNDDRTEAQSIKMASDKVISRQTTGTSIPKRLAYIIRDMWALQVRLQSTQDKRPLKLLEHQYFRAAYDLLLLRAPEDEALQSLANWWTTFQQQHMGTLATTQKRTEKSTKLRHTIR